jgi:hypothetical protein
MLEPVKATRHVTDMGQNGWRITTQSTGIARKNARERNFSNDMDNTIIRLWNSLRRHLRTHKKLLGHCNILQEEYDKLVEDYRLALSRELAFKRAVDAGKECEAERNVLLGENAQLRAQIAHLRVHGMTVRGRTGYGVTAFVPNEVLDKVRHNPEKQDALRTAIFDALLHRALAAMWNINSRGAIMATIFSPPDVNGNSEPCGVLFDSSDRIVMAEVTTSTERRRLKQ